MATKLCTANLSKIAEDSPSVAQPKYDRSKVTPGIVHLGVGNFHRAHQCVFVDDALSLPDHEKWAYAGIGLMPQDEKMGDILKEQDTLYTLVMKGVSTKEARIMGCHQSFTLAPKDPQAALDLLTADTTKIITMTVTEKGYFVDFATGKLLTSSPIVQADIEFLKSGKTDSISLKTAAGYIVAAARKKKTDGKVGFTVLSCDNVQENGEKAQAAVLEMADATDADVAAWIRKNVTFPNSMVDRITPVTTEEFKAELASEYKITDGWPVCSESFLLWVVEDKFPLGRPSWDKTKSGKCIFTDNVVPYELLKLRLLNAVHQALSYPGALLGHELVHDAMADARVSDFLKMYMAAAARTCKNVKGLNKKDWQTTVIDRFSNPAIRDTIFRLNEDATNRIAVALAPCLNEDAVDGKKSLSDKEIYAILCPVACWLRSLLPDESDGAGPMPKAAKLNRDDKGETVKGPAADAWKAIKGDDSDAAEEAAKKFLVAAFGSEEKGPSRPPVAKALVELVKTLQSGGVEAALKCVYLKAHPLKKPKFMDIGKIKPPGAKSGDKRFSINVYGKVVKSESAGDYSTVSIGDSTGKITLRVPSDRAKVCEDGKTVRVQNAKAIMVEGHIQVLVDKWAALKAEEKDVGEISTNDVSAVEYELA